MTSAAYDVVVIGGGHNGLVAAAYLARAGRRVLVLEQRGVLGGAAATEPAFPGYQVDTGAHDARLLRPEVVDELGLRRHGLQFAQSPCVVVAPQPGGRALTFWRNMVRTQEEIRRYSDKDAERFPEFVRLVERLIGALDGVMTLTPPDLGELARRKLSPAELLPWARVALGARGLGKQDMMTLLRVLPMTAAEFLGEWFESEAVLGLLAAAGVAGGPFGPMASGTAFMLLYHQLGAAGGHQYVCGGLGQLSAALAAAARQHGAEVRTGAAVEQIELEDDGDRLAARGVRLAGGEVIRARVVVSSADPRRTLFGLAGAPNLDPRDMRRVRNIRYRGCTARVSLALSALPRFLGAQETGPRVVISPGLTYLERGADDAKYGRISQRPLLDIAIPTVLDASLAPAGCHLLSATVQWAPYHLREGSWPAQAEALADRVVETLGEYAPDLPGAIVHRQVLTPLDYEREYGLTEGNIYHGEMGLDQLLFMRPAPGLGQYRTPIAGLYLCGAGTHPGGGVTGAPGRNAAREVMKDLRRRV